jgi:hypothetical protein
MNFNLHYGQSFNSMELYVKFIAVGAELGSIGIAGVPIGELKTKRVVIPCLQNFHLIVNTKAGPGVAKMVLHIVLVFPLRGAAVPYGPPIGVQTTGFPLILRTLPW